MVERMCSRFQILKNKGKKENVQGLIKVARVPGLGAPRCRVGFEDLSVRFTELHCPLLVNRVRVRFCKFLG